MLAWNFGCTVAELEHRLSALEFVEWTIFMQEEGLLPAVHDARHAEVLAALHNGALMKRSRQFWEPKEFLRERWKPRQEAGERRKLRGSKALMSALRGEEEH